MTVYAANGDSNKTELQLGSKLPLLYNIAVVDLRGLSDKAAEEKMKEAENEWLLAAAPRESHPGPC